MLTDDETTTQTEIVRPTIQSALTIKEISDEIDRQEAEALADVIGQMEPDEEVIALEVDVELGTDTLVRDLTAAFLDRIKGLQKPWAEMTHGQQEMVILDMTSAATRFCRHALVILASQDCVVIEADLKQATVKDGIKAVVEVSQHHEHALDLIQAVGKTVLVVLAGLEDFDKDRYGNKPDVPRDNQPGLPLPETTPDAEQGQGHIEPEDEGPLFDRTAAGGAQE